MKEIHTPSKSSIEDVAAFLKKSPQELLKVLFYAYEGGLCAVVLTGDRDVNEVKLKRYLDADDIRFATPEEAEKACGAPMGFCGPQGLAHKKDLKVIVDSLVVKGQDYVAGANKKDFHVENVVPGRDFEYANSVDIHKVRAGDACTHCGSDLLIERGIEVGHVFKLGTKYSESMKALFTDVSGKQLPMIMGCYGIGVTRTAAASIEQNHDELGIVFPPPLAPFDVSLVLVDTKDALLKEHADGLYTSLLKAGIDVLYDEREGSPGVKFKDSELLGIPLRITVGKKSFQQGKVEAKIRWKSETVLLDPQEITSWIREGLSLRVR